VLGDEHLVPVGLNARVRGHDVEPRHVARTAEQVRMDGNAKHPFSYTARLEASMSIPKSSVGDSNIAPTKAEPAKMLQNAKDLAVRPGFRAPANTKSKAQKNKKKKK
jgi:hypothetical protein